MQDSSEQQRARTFRSHPASSLTPGVHVREAVALQEALASHFTKLTAEIRKTPPRLNSAPVFNHVKAPRSAFLNTSTSSIRRSTVFSCFELELIETFTRTFRCFKTLLVFSVVARSRLCSCCSFDATLNIKVKKLLKNRSTLCEGC